MILDDHLGRFDVNNHAKYQLIMNDLGLLRSTKYSNYYYYANPPGL